MRYQFNQIFRENPDGSLSAVRQLRVGGVTFGPGISIGQNAVLGGINFYQYKDHEFETEDENGILIIKAIY